MLNHFYDVYSDEQHKGELLSNFLVYEFEDIIKNDRMCVIMISFPQQGFMGSEMKWNTTVRDK